MTRVIQITDPHLGAAPAFELAGVRTLETFQAVVDDSLRLNPDIFLVTGDIAAEPNSEAYEQFFDIIKSTTVPMIWLPGNHDEASLVQTVKGATPYRKTYDIANWRILLLDSVLPNSPNGQFGEDELELLKRLLAENTQEHLLVTMHHHPIPVGSRWLDLQCITDAYDFLRLISENRSVRGVHWGHIHQAFEEVSEGVLFASAPSTCVQFKPNSDEFALDDQLPGFRIIDLASDGSIQTEVIRTPVKGFHVELGSTGY